jgi:hypothetical protein
MSTALTDCGYCAVPLHLLETRGDHDSGRCVAHLVRVPQVYYRVGDKIDLSFYLGPDSLSETVRLTIVEADQVRLLDVIDADLPLVGVRRSGRDAYLERWYSYCRYALAPRGLTEDQASEVNPTVWRIRWIYDAVPLKRMILL